ncbi:MAG TPA: peptide chain release factor N(5)-glutamine methyltransferase [Candidatus Binatia bacterium]|nr:peptide chain release factor N(5)-glutamine methyltransferase [Candidatus Binatia bacterium]
MSVAAPAAAAATVGSVLAAAQGRLASSPSAALDAEVLLAHLLGTSRGALRALSRDPLPVAALAAYDALVTRRAAGEPVAYIVGYRDFWSLRLTVTPDVLVPRPETELLVEWGIALLSPRPKPGPRVMDLGTGSGAIALAVAVELRDASIVATDISSAALAVARGNASSLGVTHVSFLQGNGFEALEPGLRPDEGRFDLILSNPPYIAEGDPHLSDLAFEPAIALTSGPDGLRELRAVVGGARAHLATGGWLLVEHGHDQGAAVRALFAQAGFEAIETRRDLAGHERATGGRAP